MRLKCAARYTFILSPVYSYLYLWHIFYKIIHYNGWRWKFFFSSLLLDFLVVFISILFILLDLIHPNFLAGFASSSSLSQQNLIQKPFSIFPTLPCECVFFCCYFSTFRSIIWRSFQEKRDFVMHFRFLFFASLKSHEMMRDFSLIPAK